MSNVSLCDYCKKCRKSRVPTDSHPLWETSSPADRIELGLYEAGKFAIECDGIPADYKDYLPRIDRQLMSEEEINVQLEILNPTLWAEENISWEGRVSKDGLAYQDLIIQCTARKKVLRIGRRAGKTKLLQILALNNLFTRENFAILVVTPFNSQKNLFVDGIEDTIERNPILKRSVVSLVHTPNFELELTNGSKLIAFTAGSSSSRGAANIRGQNANMIILDEADYLAPADFAAIMFIMGNAHPMHGLPRLIASSTPSGERRRYYDWCQDPTFKEFHFQSSISPDWSLAVEREFRDEFTEIEFGHEVLAEFGEDEQGVFKTIYVDPAFTSNLNYDISRLAGPREGWIYCFGCDWNSAKHGTKIYVIGLNPENQKFEVVDSQSVASATWNLTSAVNKLVELNEFWCPAYIYVDEGYGAFQVETLKNIGLQAPNNSRTRRLATVVKGINFGSYVELIDPWYQEKISKPFKPFLVQNTVRVFEKGIIRIPLADTELKEQLLDYKIFRVTKNNQPVYGAKHEDVGDHCYTPDHEILTLNGWKNISEITLNDYIAAPSRDGKLKYEQPLRIVRNYYNGNTYRVDDNSISFRVTDQHQMAYVNKKDYLQGNIAIKTTTLDKSPYSMWAVSALSKTAGKGVDMSDEEIYALGFFQAEGFTNKTGAHYRIFWTQRPGLKYDKIKRVLIHLYGDKVFEEHYRIGIYSKLEYDKFKKYGKSWNKYIDRTLLNNMSEKQLWVLFESLMDGDGHRAKPNGGGSHYDTCSPQLASDFQELCFRLGIKTNLVKYPACATTRSPFGYYYRIWIKRTKPFAGYTKKDIITESYSGLVHCVTVTDGLIVVRRNGKIHIGSNCLDALMLGLLAFTKEMSEFSDPLPTIGLTWAHDPSRPAEHNNDLGVQLTIQSSPGLPKSFPNSRTKEIEHRGGPLIEPKIYPSDPEEQRVSFSVRGSGMTKILTGKMPKRSNF